MLTLHLARGTISVAAHIALEETGLPHELAWLDFGRAEQTSESYARVNPKLRVPALVTPDGILTETPAILEHIASLAPEADLMPADPWAAAKAREAMAWCAATFHVAHAHKMRGARWADDPDAHEAMAAKVPETMTACASLAEEMLTITDGPWLLEAVSVADFHLHAIARWLPGDGVDLAPFSRLQSHAAAVASRPAAARALSHHG
ncbi:glutathione S-transferase family protein [Jannaschia aquimarina]|uniref:GstB_2 protein n=1 Tax=Jannaschia aquimarina TaxID=935700 RepID=A0A0D1DBA5_9RHOB|nr:glutathione S-transferase [Jannaschia aquimarina]KIT17233.1 Glutathione S-transferase GST-6.0 [Jannaschia aquimarina]SNT18854.1 glutathione S-transferase [Jannaschia aquimarina]